MNEKNLPQHASAESHPVPYPTPYPDDEISLVDLAKVLYRRRYWGLGIAFLCILGAAGVAVTQTPQYNYTSNVVLGETRADNYVMGAEAARNVLVSNVIPLARDEFLAARQLERLPFRIEVKAERNNHFIDLVSTTASEHAELVEAWHRFVIDALAGQHNRRLEAFRKEGELRVRSLRQSLAAEERQLAELQELLSVSTRATGGAGHGELTVRTEQSDGGFKPALTTDDATLALLLSRLQLSELINSREQRIAELRGELEQEEFRLEQIQPTHAAMVAVVSEDPVGTGRKLLLALGIVLGGLLGFFGAFMAEFVSRVRSSIDADA